MNTAFIGFDAREATAFDVCRNSMLRHSSEPLHIEKLLLPSLQHAGLYRRTWHIEDGQKVDDIDGLPFSTEFSFSRFLVPAAMHYEGWALFVDCDFLFFGDVADLFAQADDSKAALVCQQMHHPQTTFKMDRQTQTRYMRKNWSSLMLLNCGHPSVKRNLTVDAVNTQPGRWLHGFAWCADEEIGEIDPAWNWIEGVTRGAPKAVHYTEGGPWFPAYADVAYAAEWQREFRLCGHYAIVERGLPDPRRYAA